MSRRDTILFAVLINVGLLVVLFVTAMKPESESIGIVVSPNQQEEQVADISTDKKDDVITKRGGVGDEVDQLLDQLSSRSYRDTEVISSSEESSVSDGYREIIVKRGDVLGRIARLNGVSVEELMKANNLSNSRLSVGQVLRIPEKKEIAVVQQEEVPIKENVKDEDVRYYTVRSGDNPWLIARRNKLDLQDLLRLNELDENTARRLKPGDKLRVN